MAANTPTYLDLKNQVASMLGAESVEDLADVDQTRVGIYVNQAYRECYSPISGDRPRWASRSFGLHMPAPEDVTVTVTKGSSDVVIDFSGFSENYLGSFLKIEGNLQEFHVISDYSATPSPTLSLQAPVVLDSGDYSGTVYFNSYVLEEEIIDIDRYPEIQGKGALSALNSPEVAVAIRSWLGTDFRPTTDSIGNVPTFSAKGTNIKTENQPLFYYIDPSALVEDVEPVQNRFMLYPVPTQESVITFTANVIPQEMSVDTQKPRLPGNVVWDILLPIAQAKLVQTDPRYNGQNKEMVLMAANEARKRLNTLTSSQKQKVIRLTKRRGW